MYKIINIENRCILEWSYWSKKWYFRNTVGKRKCQNQGH